jgi:hypothetical protein
MFEALSRAAERWRSVNVTDFERRQRPLFRKQLDEEYETQLRTHMTSSKMALSPKIQQSSDLTQRVHLWPAPRGPDRLGGTRQEEKAKRVAEAEAWMRQADPAAVAERIVILEDAIETNASVLKDIAEDMAAEVRLSRERDQDDE